MGETFLQIFLLVNVFVMGMLVTLAIRHAHAHYRPRNADAPKLPVAAPDPKIELPATIKERLFHQAEANFLAELNRSAGELQADLAATAEKLNQQLAQLGAEVTAAEKGRYSAMLDAVRKQTEASLAQAQTEIDAHQADLKTKLEEEHAALSAKMGEQVAAEQKRLLEQIDTKLADAVASFLLDTLKHNIDLGAQGPYLTALLEEHKDEFKQEVSSGDTPAAK